MIGALPKELQKRRHDVRVILPKYKTIRAQEFGIKETGEMIRVSMGDRIETGDIRATKTEKGIKVYFINHEGFFGRSGLYGGKSGDYADNAERFIFFSRAVLEACKAMEFRPDIIHCHDWQTGLIPAYLKTLFKTDAFFQHTASVMTIHNMAYQGVFPKTILPLTGLPWSEFTMDKIEFYDQVNFLKAGLAYADKLTTVSPTYAQQVQSSVEFGYGLEGFLQKRSTDFSGILNGLDVDEWNPARDPFLAKSFDLDSMAGRRDCKAHLQHSLKLPMDARIPMLAMVARLDRQKGVDLLASIVPTLMSRPLQLVVLGQGDPQLQDLLERFETQYPQSFRSRSDFNDPLAHHIYGGCDIFLMPSRFEPCGLGQLIAMRYGAIPVVSDTGGLHDTVRPVTGKESGTGFLFSPGSAAGFRGAIQDALHFYSDKTAWGRLQRRAMLNNFSWDQSAQSYLDIYRQALGRTSGIRRSVKIV